MCLHCRTAFFISIGRSHNNITNRRVGCMAAVMVPRTIRRWVPAQWLHQTAWQAGTTTLVVPLETISSLYANKLYVKNWSTTVDLRVQVSNLMGEGEKLVKQLFNMARENSPSIFFINEVYHKLCSYWFALECKVRVFRLLLSAIQPSSAHNSKTMDTMSQQVDLECVWCYWFADSSSGCEKVGV